MRLALTAAALYTSNAFVRPSATRHCALRATGDRWYCGEGVKYPRGASNMPPAPPPETGGYSHEPQLFDFWADTNYDYEVALARPLGIVFEEIGTAAQPMGVKVIDVGGNAAASGKVSVGDVLVGVTAVRYPGSAYLGAAKPERDIFPAHEMNFDTVVEAIGSNEPPECDDVILRLRRAA